MLIKSIKVYYFSKLAIVFCEDISFLDNLLVGFSLMFRQF